MLKWSFRAPCYLLVGAALCLAGLQRLQAQTATGSIAGIVHDPSQAPVTGANLTLTNVAINESRSTTTNNLGYYSFPLLPPATYQLKVNLAGFRSFVVEHLTLDVAQAREQNVSLNLARPHKQ